MPRRKIRRVLKRHTDDLMAVLGVVGVAEGESQGRQCIKVFVVDRNSELLKVIPNTLEGYLLQVEQSNEFRALST